MAEQGTTKKGGTRTLLITFPTGLVQAGRELLHHALDWKLDELIVQRPAAEVTVSIDGDVVARWAD